LHGGFSPLEGPAWQSREAESAPDTRDLREGVGEVRLCGWVGICPFPQRVRRDNGRRRRSNSHPYYDRLVFL
jgi:hypothetical protein